MRLWHWGVPPPLPWLRCLFKSAKAPDIGLCHNDLQRERRGGGDRQPGR
jgi:hypothetical protein